MATEPEVAYPRDRATEEPRGRWEDRCAVMTAIAADAVLICDRPNDHHGLHRGRLVVAGYGSVRVVGYGGHR